MIRVEVKPEMMRWVRERARADASELIHRFPQLPAWERGEVRPTLKQLESFANATHTPVGFLFLQEPPAEEIPIPDFRTVDNEHLGRPSPDLLDTLYICQQRQEWFRDFMRSEREEPLPFVGSATLGSDIEATAAGIRSTLGFDFVERRQTPTWTEALRRFIEQADELGVLIMLTGVVGSNNRRRLDPEEFRGFALSDPLAPLVFINGADTKAAQMFTLAHELAHIWLGQSALSDVGLGATPSHQAEIWCNAVAAELLVPIAIFRHEYHGGAELRGELDRLARRFKVSTLVILRRIHDVGGFTREELWQAYREELKRLMAFPKREGGSFYSTLAMRVSKRFARALVVNTLEGQTLYHDAFRLLGFSKLSTFRELGHRLGVA
jgi:Zn-dependent peptidase ImmA (M78 family)